mgnify:FL=1|jgi:hypothetical protein
MYYKLFSSLKLVSTSQIRALMDSLNKKSEAKDIYQEIRKIKKDGFCFIDSSILGTSLIKEASSSFYLMLGS